MKNPCLIASSVSCKKKQQNVLLFVLSYPFKRNEKTRQVTKKIKVEEGCPIIFLVTANKLKYRSSPRSQCETSRILIPMGNY